MTTTTTTPAAVVAATAETMATRVATVRIIGKGERLTAVAVPEILASRPEGFDPAVRGAITGLVHAWACGDAPRPAVSSGKGEDSKRTDYGVGVAVLSAAVKRAIAAESTPDASEGEGTEDAAGESTTGEPATPDYLALAVQACATALANGVDPRALMDAIRTGALTTTVDALHAA